MHVSYCVKGLCLSQRAFFETPPNSVSISGLSRTTVLIILFPGAFFRHTHHIVAPVKDVTYALKRNFYSSAGLICPRLTSAINSCLLAATETKPFYAIADMHILSLASLLLLLCILDCIQAMVKYIFIKSPDEWATTKQACRDKRVVRLNLFLYLIPRSTHMY